MAWIYERFIFSIFYIIFGFDNTTAHSIIDNNAYDFMQIPPQERILQGHPDTPVTVA